MGDSRHYRAFISYSHNDARVAMRLHRSLENYRVPKHLRATAGEFGPVPDRLSPIFCDREELASSSDLGSRVQDALADSDALLVVCSPDAARSRWVNEEVLSFKRLGGGRRVYCVIVAGEPNAGDARECFPPALRFEVDECSRNPALLWSKRAFRCDDAFAVLAGVSSPEVGSPVDPRQSDGFYGALAPAAERFVFFDLSGKPIRAVGR